jgi:hypothetical protein
MKMDEIREKNNITLLVSQLGLSPIDFPQGFTSLEICCVAVSLQASYNCLLSRAYIVTIRALGARYQSSTSLSGLSTQSPVTRSI